MKVLITSVGAATAVALIDNFRSFDKNIDIIGTDIN
jgi:hypothetical protein